MNNALLAPVIDFLNQSYASSPAITVIGLLVVIAAIIALFRIAAKLALTLTVLAIIALFAIYIIEGEEAADKVILQTKEKAAKVIQQVDD